MMFTPFELVALGSAGVAILMSGSMQLKANFFLYALGTLMIGIATALTGYARHETGLYIVAAVIALLKGCFIPLFLSRTIDLIHIEQDKGTIIVAPLAMHLCVFLFGLSYLLVLGLPVPAGEVRGWPGAMSAISLLFTGLVLMLTRRLAISQIIGFLVLENGIYLFALTQTRGMPMIVEMGVLLDVLVGVMISGLLAFRIQRSFEHIDVTRLTELRD